MEQEKKNLAKSKKCYKYRRDESMKRSNNELKKNEQIEELGRVDSEKAYTKKVKNLER